MTGIQKLGLAQSDSLNAFSSQRTVRQVPLSQVMCPSARGTTSS